MNQHTLHQQWLQARHNLQHQEHESGKRLLQLLAKQNHAPAQTDLAMILLMDEQNPEQQHEALELLRCAEQTGYTPAVYQLACMSLNDALLPLHWPELQQRLNYCVQQQYPSALCDMALYWAHFGSDEEAQLSTTLLELAALKGHQVSMAVLGERLANGFLCKSNPRRANSIRQLALSLNLPVTEPDITLGFSPAEPDRVPEALQNISAVHLENACIAKSSTILDTRIDLHCTEAFFSTEECLYIRCAGGPYVQASITADNEGQHIQNRIRSSFDFLFLPEHEEIYLKLLQRRMSHAANLPLKNSEPLILLRYFPGQEYQPHRDYLPATHYTALQHGGSGQRQRTVICYLNTPQTGGATNFPLLDVKVPAQTGQLLRFDNINADAALNTQSLHAGEPVIAGVKWVCTLWFRQSTHRLI